MDAEIIVSYFLTVSPFIGSPSDVIEVMEVLSSGHWLMEDSG